MVLEELEDKILEPDYWQIERRLCYEQTRKKGYKNSKVLIFLKLTDK